MARVFAMGSSYDMVLCALLIFSSFLASSSSSTKDEDFDHLALEFASFSVTSVKLNTFDWRYPNFHVKHVTVNFHAKQTFERLSAEKSSSLTCWDINLVSVILDRRHSSFRVNHPSYQTNETKDSGQLGTIAESYSASYCLVSYFRVLSRLGRNGIPSMLFELPLHFSAASISVDTDVDTDLNRISKEKQNSLPLICFRSGGPPLPDLSADALKGLVLTQPSSIEFLQDVDPCYPLQKKMAFILQYGQIPPGVYYIGFFNGLGPARTQSRMIDKGQSYTFSTNITAEGCWENKTFGKQCNVTVDELLCSQPNSYGLQQLNEDAQANNSRVRRVEAACKNSTVAAWHNYTESFFSLEVLTVAEQLVLEVTNLTVNQASSIAGEIALVCYARYNALPEENLYDYSVEISSAPMINPSPVIGTWYFKMEPIYRTQSHLEQQNGIDLSVQYTLEWELLACPDGKAGSKCTWERHMLKEAPGNDENVPCIYLPHSEDIASGSANFTLGPLLTKSLNGNESDFAWTYFLFHISQGTAGMNINIELVSDTKMSYDIYARYGALPSLDVWDFCYRNQIGNNRSNSMFKLYSATEYRINFDLLYAREGPWVVGLRHPVDGPFNNQTTMSVSIESCSNECSSKGICNSQSDGSGNSSYYSYCTCDRDRGGFDCADEMFSTEDSAEKVLRSVCLIGSNLAAMLPGLWALWHNTYAEGVIFAASGLSSGFYHSCDSGLWCALKYYVLQFVDFWLSFLAVVSTFLYLPNISEAAKRAIQITAAIITAILTRTGPTRFRNIIIVPSLGVVCLVLGWLAEFFTEYRWQNYKAWPSDLRKALKNRFRWRFVIVGLALLSLAVTSLILENARTYWIWHSIWHVTIYTCAFFFLLSKARAKNGDGPVGPNSAYELTRQDSK